MIDENYCHIWCFCCILTPKSNTTSVKVFKTKFGQKSIKMTSSLWNFILYISYVKRSPFIKFLLTLFRGYFEPLILKKCLFQQNFRYLISRKFEFFMLNCISTFLKNIKIWPFSTLLRNSCPRMTLKYFLKADVKPSFWCLICPILNKFEIKPQLHP